MVDAKGFVSAIPEAEMIRFHIWVMETMEAAYDSLSPHPMSSLSLSLFYVLCLSLSIFYLLVLSLSLSPSSRG